MHRKFLMILFILICVPVFAQEGQFVKVHLRNKTVLAGEFQGIRNGKYIISVAGVTKEIPDVDVIDVEFDTKPPEAPAIVWQKTEEAVPQVDIGQINKSLEDIEKAITYVNDIVADYSKKQESVLKSISSSKDNFKIIFITTHQEYVNRLILNEQSNRMADEIRRVVSLPSEYNPVLEHIIAQAEGLIKRSPKSDFTINFSKSLSESGYTSALATPEQKKRILSALDELIDRIKDTEDKKAVALLEVKARLVPQESDNIKAKIYDIHNNAEQNRLNALYKRINELIKSHKFTEARTLLTEIFSKYPDNQEAEALSKLLEQEKSSITYSLVKALIDVGKFDQAKEEIGKILQAEPNDSTALELLDSIKKKELVKKCQLIKVHIDGNNFDQARAILNEELITHKNDQKTLLELEKELNNKCLDSAKSLIAQNRMEEAGMALSKFLAVVPDDPVALELKNKLKRIELDKKCDAIKALMDRDNFEQAKTITEELYTAFANEPALLNELKGRVKKIELDRKCQTVKSLINNSEYEKAEALIKETLAKFGDDETLLQLEQSMYAKMRDDKINLVKGLIKDGNLDLARAQIEELSASGQNQKDLLELKQTLVDAVVSSAKALIEQNNFEKAKAVLNSISSAYPGEEKVIEIEKTIVEKEKEGGQPKVVTQKIEPPKVEIQKTGITKPETQKVATHTPLDQNSYFPIKEGLWHKYRLGHSNFTEKLKLESVNTSKNDDGTEFYDLLYSVEREYKSYSTSTNFEAKLNNNSLTRVGIEGEEVLIKFPIKEGESWSWEDERTSYTRKYVSISAEVSTTAGKFANCLAIEFTSSMKSLLGPDPVTVVSKEYYAQGVGLVKIEFTSPEYSDQSRELVDWVIERPKLAEGTQSQSTQVAGQAEIKQSNPSQVVPLPPPYNDSQPQSRKEDPVKQKEQLIEKHRSWF